MLKVARFKGEIVTGYNYYIKTGGREQFLKDYHFITGQKLRVDKVGVIKQCETGSRRRRHLRPWPLLFLVKFNNRAFGVCLFFVFVFFVFFFFVFCFFVLFVCFCWFFQIDCHRKMSISFWFANICPFGTSDGRHFNGEEKL